MEFVEQLTFRREFVYSILSVLLSILLTLVLYQDLGQLITTDGHHQLDLSFLTFFGLVLSEGIKLGLIFLVFYPSSHRGIFNCSSKSSYYCPPFSSTSTSKKSTSTFGKVLQLWDLVSAFILCWFVVHVFVILFGAPMISKFVLTAQFSISLTAWIFAPLVLVFPPKDILKQVVYFSTWNYKLGSISRARIRLMSTICGAMGGVVFIPLDWDRPWQMWPLPVLFSAFCTVTAVNFLFLGYFMYSFIQSSNFYMSKSTSRNSGGGSSGVNKTKNF